jgi:hypothetical protein
MPSRGPRFNSQQARENGLETIVLITCTVASENPVFYHFNSKGANQATPACDFAVKFKIILTYIF